MGELILWKQKEIDRLRKDMDQLFRRFRKEFGIPRSLIEVAELFSMDVSETENTLTLKTRLPGIIKPDDIEVSVTEDTLTLKAQTGEDTVETSEGFRRVEKRSRTFSRTISLPCRVLTDDVKATFENGVLQIVLPKCEPKQARGVKIDIK
ncbi:MAG: Hsp20/alpha crystallin family protein [Deltaproteobacteria bacterium]|jgi:HSP20 family protein|nr:Hsp20/alpha crystallin family protein [Deltaproteobacteria bacterium]